jgi:hypothetical protein
MFQGRPELPEEAASDRLGRECIRRPSGKGHRSSARAAGQPGKRAYNLRIWIEKVQLQMRETIKGRGNGEPASGTIQGKHDCRLTPSTNPTSQPYRISVRLRACDGEPWETVCLTHRSDLEHALLRLAPCCVGNRLAEWFMTQGGDQIGQVLQGTD